jgi:hypothetical protein
MSCDALARATASSRGNLQGILALDEQRRFQRVDVVWKTVANPIHGVERIMNRSICDTPKCTREDIFRLSRRSSAAM